MRIEAMSKFLVCWNCGTSLENVSRPITRHVNCPNCYEFLHCCRMCQHYAPSRPAECDDDRADPPVIKESANFCEYFSPAFDTYESAQADRKKDAESELAALFDKEVEEDPSKDPAPSGQDDVRSKLDALFKDDTD